MATTALVAGLAVLAGPPGVSYTNRSFVINGTPRLLLSGSVHYSRVHPSDWEGVFATAKELGLNTIQTYVTWNQHEHQRGNISWAGFGDLPRFIELAAKQDLLMVVRIGPYICGEYYFGGLPIWLRDVDGIECFRCSDPIWEREMQRWVGIVVEKVKPYLASRGGPVIMLQVENEYQDDDPYLEWAVDMARNITTEVPWNLCHNVGKCGDLNDKAGSDKVLCTINGFWMENNGGDGQPGPEFFEALWSKNPKQPAAWTEDQGWFDQWGKGQRVRWSSDQIYGIARFFAYGGSYHNFYMLTGGNNYGRKSGGEVVTAYAPDTVIDNLLLRHEPRFSFYQNFFRVISAYAEDLLAHPPAVPLPLKVTPVVPEFTLSDSDYTPLGLTTCYQYDDPRQHWIVKSSSTTGVTLSPKSNNMTCISAAKTSKASVSSCDGSAEQLWTLDQSTHQIESVVTRPCQRPWMKGQKCHVCLDLAGDRLDLWDCKGKSNASNQDFALNGDTILHSGQCVTVGVAPGPAPPRGTGAEAHVYGRIAFVSNFNDFVSSEITFEDRNYFLPNHTIVLVLRATGEILFNSSALSPPVKVNAPLPSSEAVRINWTGIFREPVGYGAMRRAASQSPEQLAITDNDSDYLWYSVNTTKLGNVDVKTLGDGTITYIYIDGKLQSAGSQVATQDGQQRQIDVLSVAMGLYNGGVGPTSVKGVQSVSVGGVTLNELATAWILRGEELEIFEPGNVARVNWSPIAKLETDESLFWLRGVFDLPASVPSPPENGGAGQPNQTAVVLNLSGLNKGVAYVNGFNIGRYYLVNGQCDGVCAPPIHGSECYIHWKNCGKPTQHLYHIPFAMLRPFGNVVVLFEETATVQPRDLGRVEVNVLRAHPAAN